ncbi:MAG: triose-phosphate isomerase [Acidobacteriota bacterium]
MRIPLIIANWKMNKTDTRVRRYMEDFLPLVKEIANREIAIAPPFVSLITLRNLIVGTGIKLCGQNMHWEYEGAYTGEISGTMLSEIGCSYVILGHSERREFFGETDERVQKKLQAAISAGLTPILCIGEKDFERDAERTFIVVEYQLRKALGGINLAPSRHLVIAYEPVWAIGTGRTAKPEQANEVHIFIRELLENIYNPDLASKIRIIYGGSVTPDNIGPLMSKEEIDGVLVGGASLDAEKFSRIVRFHIE